MFVTFRVEAVNQRGAMVTAYDYTCTVAYAQGKKAAPVAGGSLRYGAVAKGPSDC